MSPEYITTDDCFDNVNIQKAILEIFNNTPVDLAWTPSDETDPDLAFGNAWLTYWATSLNKADPRATQDLAAVIDPALTLNDCTTGLGQLHAHLASRHPDARIPLVSAMTYAIGQYRPAR